MPIRFGIASSGLGRIKRGNEVWAETLARELARRGTAATLFGAQPLNPRFDHFCSVPCFHRESPAIQRWLPWDKRYLLEQWAFSFFLQRRLAADPVDILHIPDPALADWMRRWNQRKNLKVIYKDGLLLGPPWCRRFDFVQVLAPQYLSEAQAAGVNTDRWFVIPHMVDPQRFSPAAGGKQQLREQLFKGKVSSSCFVVLAIGDFSIHSQKRLDWIAQEMCRLPASVDAQVVFAGHSKGSDSAGFEHRVRPRLGDRAHFATNLSYSTIHELYRAADVFAHAALREPFGIVFLEAMACGLPVAAHCFPTTQWIVGAGGQTIDMTQPGALAALLRQWQRDPESRTRLGQSGRERVLALFSPEKIIPLYLDMYAKVAAAPQ